MQIGTVTNQYINNYHNTACVQTYNAQQVRQVQDMSETRLMEYHQEQYREQQRWLAYILMMQFFAKENMWSLLNQMRIHRTLDISPDAKENSPVEYLPDGPIMSLLRKPQLMYVRSQRSNFMVKKKMNEEIMRDWKKSIASMPICCGRYIK